MDHRPRRPRAQPFPHHPSGQFAVVSKQLRTNRANRGRRARAGWTTPSLWGNPRIRSSTGHRARAVLEPGAAPGHPLGGSDQAPAPAGSSMWTSEPVSETKLEIQRNALGFRHRRLSFDWLGGEYWTKASGPGVEIALTRGFDGSLRAAATGSSPLSRDGSGRIAWVGRPSERIAFQRDANGQVLKRSDESRTWTIKRDVRGLPSRIETDTLSIRQSFDGEGRLLRQQNGEGDALSAQYDSEGRLSLIRFPTGALLRFGLGPSSRYVPLQLGWRPLRLPATTTRLVNCAGTGGGRLGYAGPPWPPHGPRVKPFGLVLGPWRHRGPGRVPAAARAEINVPSPRPTDRHHPLGCARHSGPLSGRARVTALGFRIRRAHHTLDALGRPTAVVRDGEQWALQWIARVREPGDRSRR